MEYVRVLHLAAQTMEANVDSALSLLLETGQPFDYAEVRELAEPKVPEAPALVLTGKPGLKIYDGTSVMQDRIGQLCREFKLPTMGVQSVARFTKAGHGDALSTFLDVLEQEAEDRRHRRIGRLRTASRPPSGKTFAPPRQLRLPADGGPGVPAPRGRGPGGAFHPHRRALGPAKVVGTNQLSLQPDIGSNVQPPGNRVLRAKRKK